MDDKIESLKNLFSDLFVKLIGFALEDEFFELLGESLEIFYNLQEGEEYEFNPSEEFLFLTWFLLDDADAENYCLIDEFLSRNSDDLTLQETQICQALKETHLTLLQVQAVKPGESMVLRDVFLGEEFEVQESSGTEGIVNGSLLYTRVFRLSNLRFLVGAGIFLDPALMEPLTQFMTEQYGLECEEGEKISFKEFLKWNGELINWWIRAYEQGEMLPSPGEGEGDDDEPDMPDKDSPNPTDS